MTRDADWSNFIEVSLRGPHRGCGRKGDPLGSLRKSLIGANPGILRAWEVATSKNTLLTPRAEKTLC